MSLAEKLKAAGFKPEASTEGEWKSYNGTYRCSWKTLRPEYDEKNQGWYVQAEWDIEEVLAGDMKRDSKYPAFRKRYYFDWENPTEDNLDSAKALANDIFTVTGGEIDFTSKESFAEAAKGIIGKDTYLRAWEWKPEKKADGTPIPEDQRRGLQQFRIQKKEVAEKKRTEQSVAF